MRRPDQQSGFTLVEVLAALVITAAFAAVVLPFASRLVTRWWLGESRVETADGWMQAVARLSDDLAQAVPIATGQGDAMTATFAAGPDFVQFIRPALARSSGARLETVRFEIRPSASGQALVRRAGRFRPGPATDFGAPATLLDGPFQFRFRAFGEDRVPQATWLDADDMPVGLELRVTSRIQGLVPPGPVILRVVARLRKRPLAAQDGAPVTQAGANP